MACSYKEQSHVSKETGVKQSLPYALGLACFFPQLTTWKGQDRTGQDGWTKHKEIFEDIAA